jgi:prepilin signal peptidase PulO-like enzyme (type II secretory pathway)
VSEFFLFLQTPSLPRDVVVALFGLCVGSFLNVLALRSLQEKSLFWPPSHCPKCEHRLGLMDLLPVVSWFALGGKCRYCKAPISWQYPFVEFITAVSFLIILHHFVSPIDIIGMMVFASTLIAVCVTDFREKLIPHEITYPAMLLGIIYSFTCQSFSGGDQPLKIPHDVMGSLAGIGISYMLFDFLAFYGLKLYSRVHGDPNKLPQDEADETAADDVDDEIDTTFDIRSETPQDYEEFEVMGGGDAVLSAVIAAWLGLSRLGTALIFGFLAGTVIGALYLVHELYKQKLLRQCIKPSLIGMAAIVAFIESFLYLWTVISPNFSIHVNFFDMPWWQFGIIGLCAGSLTGVVVVGSRSSKPFPFGPALAAGAVVAMFYDPYTIPPGGA